MSIYTKQKNSSIGICSILLVLAASTGLVSAAMINGQLPGFERFRAGTYRQNMLSPTITYQGYFSVSYNGTYHSVIAKPLCRNALPPCLDSDELVFYLDTDSRLVVRLIFYCGAGYCSRADELPFRDGARIYVKGTLIEPSQWPTSRFEPTLQFKSELYVFQYTTLPESSR